jgi:hypothetical protein
VRWKRESADDVEHTEIQAIHDRRGQDEDLPPARPVRKFPADEGSGDDDGGLGECAQEYLLRHIGLGGADLVQQVVGLVSDQEGVGQNEREAAGECQERSGFFRAARAGALQPCQVPRGEDRDGLVRTRGGFSPAIGSGICSTAYL